MTAPRGNAELPDRSSGPLPPIQRRRVVVRGQVQGVGFRPFVHRLAERFHLGGFVRNVAGGVHLEVEGPPADLDHFLTNLMTQTPPLARIDSMDSTSIPPQGESTFRIDPSVADTDGPIMIAPDLAPCDDCWREFADPSDRRYRYPFLNCTNCGPRLTIITAAPYDRARTTMAEFALCPDCLREYHDPRDRRFHAQPIACPSCGPKVRLADAQGAQLSQSDPVAAFADRILQGGIGAIKGVGGYHLVCDARSEPAVLELRRRKHREQKPLALMVADFDSADRLAHVSPAERALLESPRRPIVLLHRRPSGEIAPSVAPGQPCLGIMLPPSPLHALLAEAVGRVPLVMTSGNRSDEPIAINETDAQQRLGDIADIFLHHNRPIHVRCDDSVTRIVAGEELPLRRSRGDAPCPLPLPRACPVPILACGGQLKAVFALGRDRQALLSHHLGDLDHLAAWDAFPRDVRLYEQLFQFRPEVIVHDLHPDAATSRWSEQRARQEGLKRLAVQHHHAHLASCLAEHGLTGPALGVTFDGTGYGTDGAIWGGEFLVGDDRSFVRAAHLRYVAMPGGEQAIREPWRMAWAHLQDAGIALHAWADRIDPRSRQTIERMWEGRINCPSTSSMGRLFDALGSLIRLTDRVSYEGQAAEQLEGLAETASDTGEYPFAWDNQGSTLRIDTRPMIEGIAHDIQRHREPAIIARRFHAGIAVMIAGVCRRLREATGLNDVVLTGGVFLNALLTRLCLARLKAMGFRVFRHRRVPPSDGGLCLGQLAIAAASLTGDSPCVWASPEKSLKPITTTIC